MRSSASGQEDGRPSSRQTDRQTQQRAEEGRLARQALETSEREGESERGRYRRRLRVRDALKLVVSSPSMMLWLNTTTRTTKEPDRRHLRIRSYRVLLVSKPATMLSTPSRLRGVSPVRSRSPSRWRRAKARSRCRRLRSIVEQIQSRRVSISPSTLRTNLLMYRRSLVGRVGRRIIYFAAEEVDEERTETHRWTDYNMACSTSFPFCRPQIETTSHRSRASSQSRSFATAQRESNDIGHHEMARSRRRTV